MTTRYVPKILSGRPKDIYSACPCASGRKFKFCCLARAKTLPAQSRTGFAHPGCYGSPLLDCSRKITGEHYVSRAIQERIAVDGRVQVSGLPWLKAPTHALSPQALQSKILCERHNGSLSPLDALALQFFCRVESWWTNAQGTPTREFFPGLDLERWMLKLLAGWIAAGNAGPEINIPKDWLHVLWSERGALEPPNGLYFAFSGEPTPVLHGFNVRVLSEAPTNLAYGALVETQGLRFLLFAGDGRGRPELEKEHAEWRYRPALFEVGSQDIGLDLAWPPGGERMAIHLSITPTGAQPAADASNPAIPRTTT